jgi:hypothetical protein
VSPTEKDCCVGFVALHVVTAPVEPLLLEELDDELLDDEARPEELLDDELLLDDACPVELLAEELLLDDPRPDELADDELLLDEACPDELVDDELLLEEARPDELVDEELVLAVPDVLLLAPGPTKLDVAPRPPVPPMAVPELSSQPPLAQATPTTSIMK